MLDGWTGGVVGILGVIAVSAAVIGSVLHAGAVTATLSRAGRRLHLVPPPPPTPEGQPLERIVRDLRRLRAEALHRPPGAPVARHRGIVAAYDDVLLDACRALDIGTDLGDLQEGLERDAERLRIEFELERAGIRLAPPAA